MARLRRRRRGDRALARGGAPDREHARQSRVRPAQGGVGRAHPPGRRRVARRLRRRLGRPRRHGVRLLPAAAGGEHVPPGERRGGVPRRRGPPRDARRAEGGGGGRRRVRHAVHARLPRPQVPLPPPLHHRRRPQGGDHLPLQVFDAAPRGAAGGGQGADVLGQLLLAEAAAEARGGDAGVPDQVPEDRARRLQADGRGDAGLPLLLHLPHLHPALPAQGALHLHAAQSPAALVLRVPQQGRGPHRPPLPPQADQQQDGEGFVRRGAAVCAAHRRRLEDDGVVRLAQPHVLDDGRVHGRHGARRLLRQPVRRRGAVRALPAQLARHRAEAPGDALATPTTTAFSSTTAATSISHLHHALCRYY